MYGHECCFHFLANLLPPITTIIGECFLQPVRIMDKMGEQNARQTTIQRYLDDFNQNQNKNSEWTWVCGRKGAWVELVRKGYEVQHVHPIRNPVSVAQSRPGGQNKNYVPAKGVFSSGFAQRLHDG
jgi:hypothetical protein